MRALIDVHNKVVYKKAKRRELLPLLAFFNISENKSGLLPKNIRKNVKRHGFLLWKKLHNCEIKKKLSKFCSFIPSCLLEVKTLRYTED